MTKVAYEYFISGKVQGVWFRAGTKDEADKLNINGWAKNLADGRVHIYMQGEEEAMQKLAAWLQHGPPLAEVTECIGKQVDVDNTLDGFNILR